MERTVMAVFDSRQEAQAAWQDVVACGVDEAKVHLREGSLDDVPGAQVAEQAIRRAGWGDLVGDEDAGQYREAVRRGSYLVAVDPIPEDKAQDVASALSRHNPIDLDDRAAGWRERGWSGYDAGAARLSEAEQQKERKYNATRAARPAAQATTQATTPAASPAAAQPATQSSPPVAPQATTQATTRGPATGDASSVLGDSARTTVPVVEEDLAVGKRVVQRGGVRIYTRVTERPVEQQVTLREERAHVERRDVDRPASASDLATAFKEGSVEIRETAEEPVVEKQARVVGEVDVGKDVTERTQTVKDTVRRSDVEVEDLPASRSATTGDTATRPPRRS